MKKENKNTSNNSDALPEGFYYAREDYAGLIKRLIIGVDFAVICLMSLFMIIILIGINVNVDESGTPLLLKHMLLKEMQCLRVMENKKLFLILLQVTHFYLKK